MSRDLVIELDEKWDLLEEPPARPWRAGRGTRWISMVVLAALGFAGLTAAGPPHPPTFVLLAQIKPATAGLGSPAGQGRLLAGLLLTETDNEVIAFGPDGRERWRVPLGDNEPNSGHTGYSMWRGLLLVQHTDFMLSYRGETAPEPRLLTMAVDPVTGRPQWRLAGSLFELGDFVMIGGTDQVQIFRDYPGDPLWTVPDGRVTAIDEDGHTLVTIDDDGTVAVFDLATGRTRVTGKVEIPQAPQGPQTSRGQLTGEIVGNDLVLRDYTISDQGYPSAETRSYDLATLRPSKSVAQDYDNVFRCGPVLCATRQDHMFVLDPETHAQLWQAPDGYYPAWTDAGLLVGDQQSGTLASLVDPFTGQLRASVVGWNSVYLGDSPFNVGDLMTRFVAQDRTFVGVLRPDGIKPLGVLPKQATRCQADDDLLACEIADGSVALWRVNR